MSKDRVETTAKDSQKKSEPKSGVVGLFAKTVGAITLTKGLEVTEKQKIIQGLFEITINKMQAPYKKAAEQARK